MLHQNTKTPSVTYGQVLGAKAPAELVTEGVLLFVILRNSQNNENYSYVTAEPVKAVVSRLILLSL